MYRIKNDRGLYFAGYMAGVKVGNFTKGFNSAARFVPDPKEALSFTEERLEAVLSGLRNYFKVEKEEI